MSQRYDVSPDCICPRECSCEKPPTPETINDPEHLIDGYCPEHGDSEYGALPDCPAKQHWWEIAI